MHHHVREGATPMTVLTPGRATPPPIEPRTPHTGPLGRLARVAYRRRGRTVLAWVAALGVAIVLAATVGGEFKADYSAPGSDSQQAQTLLEDRFPSQAGDTVDVVVHADGGFTDPATEQRVTDLLAEMQQAPHVAGASDPFTAPSAVSGDGATLVAHLRLDVENPVDMPKEASQQLLDLADGASTDGLRVALGGQS